MRSLANLSKSCLRPVASKSTVALAFSPTPSTFTTTPRPKRWCSTTLPGCKPADPDEAQEEAEGAQDDALEGADVRWPLAEVRPPLVTACSTLVHRPPCRSIFSNDGEKGLTACSACRGDVILGLGSAINCPATGREFCILPLLRP